jgi:hypothetical protein
MYRRLLWISEGQLPVREGSILGQGRHEGKLTPSYIQLALIKSLREPHSLAQVYVSRVAAESVEKRIN